MSPLRPRFALAAVLVLGMVGVAACSSDDSGSSSGTTAASESSGSAASSDAPASSGEIPADGVEVEAWAGSVCGAVGTWLDGINAKGDQLSTDVQGVTELTAGRDLLVQFMEDAVSLTDAMLSSVQSAGAPAVENGEQLSADLVAALNPVKTTFESALEQAKTLPTDDPEAFGTAADQLGQEITNSQSGFAASFDALQQKYDDPALNQAFADVPACSALRGG